MKRAPPKKHHVNRELLRKLYVDENLSTVEIAERLGMSRMALNRIMKENRLSRRIEGLLTNKQNEQKRESP